MCILSAIRVSCLFLRHSLTDLRNDRLLLVTIITSFCADYCWSHSPFWPSQKLNISIMIVVASIEETAERYHIPKPFIGLILLPIVVSFILFCAPHQGLMWLFLNRQMQRNTSHLCGWRWRVRWSSRLESALAARLLVYSTLLALCFTELMAICCLQQIAAFVIPLLVIIGWMTGHELTLFFADFEVRLLFTLWNICADEYYRLIRQLYCLYPYCLWTFSYRTGSLTIWRAFCKIFYFFFPVLF